MVKFEYWQKRIEKGIVWGANLLHSNGARGVYYGLLVVAQCDVEFQTQEELARNLGLTPPTFFKYRDLLEEYGLSKRRIEGTDIVYELFIPKV